jgi:3-oxoacyl-[acyl-carrier-protein] synthase-3
MERVVLTRIEDGCCRHLHVQVDNAICTFHNGATTSGIEIKLPARASYACLQMNGKEVFRFAVRAVPQVIEAALQEAGLRGTDSDWLLLHQVKKLGLGLFFFFARL